MLNRTRLGTAAAPSSCTAAATAATSPPRAARPPPPGPCAPLPLRVQPAAAAPAMSWALSRGRGMAKSPSQLAMETLETWQEKEARNQLQSAVDEDGSLLDNLTLELRVHPPSIEIDNHAHDRWTVVTIDSANRPGSLIYVRHGGRLPGWMPVGWLLAAASCCPAVPLLAGRRAGWSGGGGTAERGWNWAAWSCTLWRRPPPLHVPPSTSLSRLPLPYGLLYAAADGAALYGAGLAHHLCPHLLRWRLVCGW